MAQDQFVNRHIGNGPEEVAQMLATIGVKSVAELIDQVVPPQIQLPGPLDLPEGMSESDFAAHIRALGAKNKPLRTLIGMGYYGTATPAAIVRNIFENPAWYTSYTPYQAEISQGRLEALLNFQTVVSSLTGLPVSNCSLLDEATAAAEAMIMMFNLRSREAQKEGRNVLFVDENIFPQTLDLLLTRSEPLGIELAVDAYGEYEFSGREFGAILQYPGANGHIADYSAFAAVCHEKGMLVTAVADILSLVLLKAPAEWGADIAVGSTQRFGIPMGFGGPHAGYMATKDAYKRNMPGRIIGVSVDRLGNPALRMALQMREQHIKRERATSNICTAQALLATMAGMFAVYHGPEGLKRIAIHAHAHAHAAAQLIRGLDYELVSENYFDTIEVVADAEKIEAIAVKKGLNLFYPTNDTVHISFDEVSTLAEVNTVAAVFAEAAGKEAPVADEIPERLWFDGAFVRTSEILTEKVFHKYHNETDLMRYIKKLERRDISLANSMISLGSCTMKLNSAVSMMPLSLAEWGNVHPFVPLDQAEGYMEMIRGLERDLAVITGFDAVSMQPNSGAAGEYTGLMVIRAYHHSRGDYHRNIALIPASAHGTNPASAAMAGMKVVVVATDANGNVDVDDLRKKAEENAANLSCLMITYPSTHGIFESKIKEIMEIVHRNGGQVYFDGANMNALVGLSSPGYIGADVCHLNLHKTFAIPHGGGGPGVGPIGVAKHLTPFLPSHPIVKTGGTEGITAVSAAPWGSAMVQMISYGYIKMLGASGLRRASEMAIVAANYMACALKGHYGIVYTGETGRVGHEMIVDCRNFRADYGVETGDIARRLMDYGFHAPTLSFPVHDTLMVEPTESEPKAELDRFLETLIAIKAECVASVGQEDHIVRNAPHTAYECCGADGEGGWNHPYSRMQAAFPLPWVVENKFWPYVSKIDAGYGDRNLVCTCDPLESYL
ncbi:aminomethyl-transferring glycine dehydrogenase [Rikenella microfusus]|uniref:aminomethyl-transferring glycine dehydrogenase n=2 Tax=Rikenella microfusus TaxID=28139 RepID=UPI001D996730|nr:aminomethyl-transferring glycine dehydrogenase [Rikenella microfusus]HJE89007.1 aminomethyl-transferring glycine dehydrogenase [Rikenella microfusus]